MYRARDAVDNDEYLDELDEAVDALDLGVETRSTAQELFLSTLPASDRSKRAVLAASLYAGALIASDSRSQSEVADAVGVSRLSVQDRWKDVLREAGLEPPSW